MEFELLGNICEVVRGSSPRPQGDKRYYGGNIPRLMIADVTRDKKYVTPIIDSLTEEGAAKSRPMKKGDLIIAVSGDPGRVCFLNVDACIHDGFVGLRNLDESKYDKEFLYYYLTFFKSSMKHRAYGAIFQNITTDILKGIKIPKLSISEQNNIATLASKAENLIAQRKESILLLDEFLKSTFLEMFGDPVRNEKGWESKPLGELCNIRRGASPRPINNYIGSEVPWIKIGDGTKGNDLYIESTQVSITKEGALKSVLLDEGSLVFANCGVSLGFARILKIKGCIHDGWLSFENIQTDLDKIFLLKLLNNSTDYLRRIAPDGTQPNLNTGIMKNFKIILPPIELQIQFAQIVEKTEVLKSQYQQSLQELENLYGSLSQRAFRGELTINKAVSV